MNSYKVEFYDKFKNKCKLHGYIDDYNEFEDYIILIIFDDNLKYKILKDRLVGKPIKLEK
jgi:hypothetical protein